MNPGQMRLWRKLYYFYYVIVVMVVIHLIPTARLRTKGMYEIEGDWVNVYYETEEEAARDVFELAEAKADLSSVDRFFTKL